MVKYESASSLSRWSSMNQHPVSRDGHLPSSVAFIPGPYESGLFSCLTSRGFFRALRVDAFFVLVLLTQVEEVRLERSVEDLSEQLNASKLALKYAERGDFTYLSKLVPGGQVTRSPRFDLPERAPKLRCSPARVLEAPMQPCTSSRSACHNPMPPARCVSRRVGE
jgi:hypothetical protein